MAKYILHSVFLFCLNIGWSQSGEIFFNSTQVHSIHINFYENNFYDSLTYYKEQGDVTGIEKYIAADVIINNDTITNVGIRFRGNSSYNHPGTKKPVQLDFNEFVQGQKYDGMKKLNLNNGYLDPSQIREKLFMDILRESGTPAPRISFSAVYFNGEYIGLYKALETINKEFLKSNFENNKGNLFKCEPETTLAWEGPNQSSYYDNAELKTNETENDWSDFVKLHYTINYSGENFEYNMRDKFNLDSYIKSWAVNNVFGNLDSYLYLPHNYYLYHDTITDKFEWITWDASLAFGVYALLVVPNSIEFDILYLPNNAQSSRPLNYYILKDESLKQQYMGEICYFLKNEFLPSELFPKIDSLGDLIKPFVELEPLANRMFSLAEFRGNLQYNTVNYQLLGQVPGLKDFIQTRRSSIIQQLCDYNWSCFMNQEITNDEVIKIYPNPGNDITLEFISPNEFHTSEFLITDLSGKKIRQWTHQNLSGTQQINLKNLAAGVYILKFESGCKETTKKFVIVK
jgi:spore coat protein H